MAIVDPRVADDLLALAEGAVRGAPLRELALLATRVRGEAPELDDRLGALMAAAARRDEEAERLRLNERRLAEAQRVGAMGSYDWHIPTDTNTWSDELYRIYGCEPQSFNASYERFMGFIHPDDRDKVQGVHMAAFKDHAPYHMEERIVRPDGEVRILDSTGEVALDDAGNPVRMYGICRDITEQRRAEEAARRHGERFEALVETSPDALLVVNRQAEIVQVNKRAAEMFGYSPDEMIGEQIELLLPDTLAEAHRAHREAFMADPVARPMGTGLEVTARRRDGTDIPVDVSLGVLTNSDGALVAAFVRDISERKRAQEYALRLHDADVRRRHALEINDNVVQGLSASLYAFDAGLGEAAMAALRSTVVSARLMMNDLLGSSEEEALEAGGLARLHPASVMLPEVPDLESVGAARPVHHVLLVDDAPDIRLILRRVFNATPGYEVVGEAADGQTAIDLAERLAPDVVLLDLAMPVMDGLQALPVIRARLPNAKIIVLSGFDGARMRQPALVAGADVYIEKGGNLAAVLSTVEDLLATAV